MRVRAGTEAGRRRGLLSLGSNREGATAVEFALLLPVLVLALAALVDLSRLVAQTMQVRAAAQAGADYALKRGWNGGAVSAAVSAATTLPVVASPAPQAFDGCVSGGLVTPATDAACPGGGRSGRYVAVSAQAPFEPMLPGPHGLVLPATLSGQALVRIQ